MQFCSDGFSVLVIGHVLASHGKYGDVVSCVQRFEDCIQANDIYREAVYSRSFDGSMPGTWEREQSGERQSAEQSSEQSAPGATGVSFLLLAALCFLSK